LLEEKKVSPDATIYICPPINCNGEKTDEDSADETEIDADHLARNQLLAEAEIRNDEVDEVFIHVLQTISIPC
jgi:hypothetical protein